MVPISHTNHFFDELPAALQGALDHISVERQAEAGEVLLRAGCQCSQLYQLRAGRMEFRRNDANGSGANGSDAAAASLGTSMGASAGASMGTGASMTTSMTTSMGKGEWIGLAEAFSGLPATCDVIATMPSRLRVIDYREFEALLDEHPALARRLLQLFSVSLSTIYYQSRDRNIMPLKDRLLRALYMLSFSHGKTLRQQQGILIEMPQEELSHRLAAARQTLNRQLKVLEREGLIRVNYGSITVLGLHRLAERQLSSGRRVEAGPPDAP